MIDDFASPGRRKPKVIEPLEKPETAPLPVLEDEVSDNVPETSTEEPTNMITTSDKKPKKSRFHIQWPRTKRQKIISLVIIVLLVIVGVVGYMQLHSTKPGVASSVKQSSKKAAPLPVLSTLTGLPVTDSSVNKRPVTAVMIENSTDARPQSGLDQAGIVFEAIAEGGVTRFMALFQDTQPSYLGPVRSARPYYIQWALGYDAGYAHVGGSPDGLADIKSWNVRDLDQFYNSGAYQRISSRDAPHNVYTSIAALNKVEQTKGYTSSTFVGFARKKDSPSKAPTATSIDLTFSGPVYNAHFDYDASSNSYKRSEAGAPHMEVDASGKQTQITPKVVVAMVVPESQGALDSSGAYYSNYNPIGSGAVTIFQDGIATPGTWAKTSNTAPLTFTDASNKPIKLNAGQTWISAILTSSDVTYK